MNEAKVVCDAEIATERKTRFMKVKHEFCSNPCVKQDYDFFTTLGNGYLRKLFSSLGRLLRTYVKTVLRITTIKKNQYTK